MFRRCLYCMLILALLVFDDIATAQVPSGPPSFNFSSRAPVAQLGRQLRGRAKPIATSDDPDLEGLLAQPETPTPLEAQVSAAWRQALGEGFQRSSANMLAALQLRQQHPEVPPAPTLTEPALTEPIEPAEETQLEADTPSQPATMSPLAAHVISGNWPVIKQLLASLPPDQRSPAYSTLLAVLAEDAAGVVLPPDVAALIETSPVPFDDRHLARLGMLLRRSLDQSEQPRELLASLKSGMVSLADDKAQQSSATVKLLLAAGLIDEARPFLLSLPSQRKETDAPQVTLHARFFYLHGKRRREAESLAQSWQLTLEVLELSDADAPSRIAAEKRVLALAPHVPGELTAPWFRKLFRDQSPLGLTLLKEIGQQTALSLQTGDLPGRLNGMRLQHLVGTELLAEQAGENDGSVLPAAFELLTRAWINEAQKGIGGPLRKMTMDNDDEVRPLPLKLLMQTAPDAAWRQSLEPDTAEHVRHLVGLLAVRTGDEAQALAVVKELVPRNPELAQQVAEALLGSSKVNEDEDEDLEDFPSARIRQLLAAQRHSLGHWSGSSQTSQVVTRAGQLRNLAKLSDLIAAIYATGVTQLSDEALVKAFADCHSDAEVYLESDIVRLFSPLHQLGLTVAFSLAGSMRAGLAEQWRDPQLQQQHGTRRTPREQAEEILRGYALTQRILNSAVDRAPTHVELRLLLAGVYFEEAEFLYGQQADLATYARQRDAAFRQFQTASEAYALRVAGLDPAQYDVDVYRHWFQAALGASDLSYLTRQDEPNQPQVEKVAAALRSLEGAAAARHQELFAQSVANALDEVPPTLKPHLVRQALAVVGDQPAAGPLRERLTYYDELLKEVELGLAVDGGDRVGHGVPFGVHVSLLGTRAVARENDAFSALLIPSGPQSLDDTDARRLEQELREKLSEAFTIEAIAFHAPQTQPRSTAREGWLELPVAYAVLRAKSPAVDRLPALQFDLEFADGSSGVRLPIRSQVALLDCRDDAPPQRPAREVKIRQLLDGRQLAGGTLRLEVLATALGVVPELDQLLKHGAKHLPGWQVDRIAAQELSIASLQTDEQVEALTERRWLVELSPASVAAPPVEFHYPEPADPAYTVAYQSYSDADIVDAASTSPLHWPALAGSRRWLWPAVLLGTLLAVMIVGAMLARRRASPQATTPHYRLPEQLTPFSVMALLRRIRDDSELPLTAADREHLEETLETLEERYFVRGSNGHADDLEPLCRRWLLRAQGSPASRISA